MKPSKLLRLAFALLATGILALSSARASQSLPADYPDETPVTVTISTDVPAGAIQPNQTFDVAITFTIEAGWHIYDSQKTEVGRPTAVNLALPSGFVQKSISWSQPSQFSEGEIRYMGYERTATVKVSLQAPAQFDPIDPAKLVARVNWLACKDQCVPGSADLPLQLTLAAATPGAQTTPASSNTKQMSLLAYLAFAFIGGVLLNLMPCVLPVLGFKIVRFIKEANQSRSKVFRLGFAYAGGTVATCMALAVIVIAAQLLGASVGWGFQFQQPLFVLALATLVTVMSLGMFGLFMMQVPVGQGISKLSQSDGYAGAFFTGVLATILSTPCTAPFLGTAVGFAFAEAWWVILLIFFTVGLGLAAPYLVLTSNPGWMKYIPKPGAWMEHLKEAMAFSLMGSVVWLLYIIGQQVGINGLIATLIFLLTASFSAWLVGRFTLYEERKTRKALIWLAAIAIPLGVFVWQVLPSYKTQTESVKNAYSEAAVSKALSEGKVVFVDFTAAWCLTCQVNEKGVLSDAEVLEEMQKLNVVFLKGDWTNGDATITAALKKHQRSGVPLYLVYSPHRPGEPVILPEILTKSAVLESLHLASQP